MKMNIKKFFTNYKMTVSHCPRIIVVLLFATTPIFTKPAVASMIGYNLAMKTYRQNPWFIVQNYPTEEAFEKAARAFHIDKTSEVDPGKYTKKQSDEWCKKTCKQEQCTIESTRNDGGMVSTSCATSGTKWLINKDGSVKQLEQSNEPSPKELCKKSCNGVCVKDKKNYKCVTLNKNEYKNLETCQQNCNEDNQLCEDTKKDGAKINICRTLLSGEYLSEQACKQKCNADNQLCAKEKKYGYVIDVCHTLSSGEYSNAQACDANCQNDNTICNINTKRFSNNSIFICEKLPQHVYKSETACNNHCSGIDNKCKQKTKYTYECITMQSLKPNQFLTKDKCEEKCDANTAECKYSTHKERGGIYTCTLKPAKTATTDEKKRCETDCKQQNMVAEKYSPCTCVKPKEPTPVKPQEPKPKLAENEYSTFIDCNKSCTAVGKGCYKKSSSEEIYVCRDNPVVAPKPKDEIKEEDLTGKKDSTVYIHEYDNTTVKSAEHAMEFINKYAQKNNIALQKCNQPNKNSMTCPTSDGKQQYVFYFKKFEPIARAENAVTAGMGNDSNLCMRNVLCITSSLWDKGELKSCNAKQDVTEKVNAIDKSKYTTKTEYQSAAIGEACGDVAKHNFDEQFSADPTSIPITNCVDTTKKMAEQYKQHNCQSDFIYTDTQEEKQILQQLDQHKNICNKDNFVETMVTEICNMSSGDLNPDTEEKQANLDQKYSDQANNLFHEFREKASGMLTANCDKDKMEKLVIEYATKNKKLQESDDFKKISETTRNDITQIQDKISTGWIQTCENLPKFAENASKIQTKYTEKNQAIKEYFHDAIKQFDKKCSDTCKSKDPSWIAGTGMNDSCTITCECFKGDKRNLHSFTENICPK